MSELVLELLPEQDCQTYLAASNVGRIAVSIEALPAILPVNYLMLEESILFRTAGTSQLYRAAVDHVVAFEIDGHDPEGNFGWSVLVRGVANEIIAAPELRLARTLWLEAWPLGERADRFVVVPTTLVTGRRFFRLSD